MLFVNQGSGNVHGVSPFEIQFSVPVNMVGFDFGTSLNAYLEVDTYSSTDTLLESLTLVGTPVSGGPGSFAGLQESTDIADLSRGLVLIGLPGKDSRVG
jgi:hypothetical protein